MTEKELFQQYYKDVFRTCFYMLKNQYDAEDVCQDVFVKIFQHDFQRITSLKPWVLSIAMNRCRNHIRKHSKVTVGLELMNWIANIIDTRGVEDQVELKEQKEHIADFIHRLRPKIREVMVLKYLHELKNEGIANILHIPIGTIKSRANKGILELRRMMEADRSQYRSQAKVVMK